MVRAIRDFSAAFFGNRYRKLARQCPDWTERRPHLAGTLGVILHKRLLELGWITPLRSSRAVGITLKGREALLKHLRIVVG
jgi:hypothetical protein